VFAGSAAGSKLDKARALGITVHDEAGLLAVLAGNDPAAPAAKTPAAPPAASEGAPVDALPSEPDALPARPKSIDPRTSTAFRALWLAESGFDVETW
jgi:hypothetical protein